jgi:hypothetical protein
VAGPDGWVATQASLQPKIACLSLMPFKAEQPKPGLRLLQGNVSSARK